MLALRGLSAGDGDGPPAMHYLVTGSLTLDPEGMEELWIHRRRSREMPSWENGTLGQSSRAPLKATNTSLQ